MAISNTNKEGSRSFFQSSRVVVVFITAITLLTSGSLMIIGFTPMPSILAQEGNNTATHTVTPGNTANTNFSLPSAIELSPQPVFEELVNVVRQSLINQTSTNQTYNQIIFSGNGTLSLPNTTETIGTTSNGIVIVASRTSTFGGKEIVTTSDGSENATIIFSGIVRFNMQDGTGRGISTAVIHTNSTGKLQPLDGMIMVSQEEILPDGSTMNKYWEWQSGIPYIKNTSDMSMESEMNAKTSTTTTSSELPSTTMP